MKDWDGSGQQKLRREKRNKGANGDVCGKKEMGRGE